MTIDYIVNKFNSTPFLFVGSGMSRRYLNLPDWKGLLKHFASIIDIDEFAYRSYENKVAITGNKDGELPKIAELIQQDFDKKWVEDSNIRTVDKNDAKINY